MNRLRKFLAASVLTATLFTTTGVSFSSAATDGDLIKMNGLSSVYYLKGGKRFVFPNQATYASWYSDNNGGPDWTGIKTISQSELESYPLGGNVTVRPGTKLVKITTNPTVYAVEPNGTLRSIVSEANAIALWGAAWNKNVIDVADSFFTNYVQSTPLNVGVYPVGTVVNPSNSSDLFYWDGMNYRKFSNESAFLANGFNFTHVVTTSKTIVAGGTSITSAEAGLMNVAGGAGTGGNTVPGGSLTAALSSDTPASMSIPVNVGVDMLHFNLTAGNDGDATINGIKLTQGGLGAYSDVTAVSIYANGKKLGNSRDIDSNHNAQINFTTPLVIAKGTTQMITVKAQVSGTNQYNLGIWSASDITTSGNSAVSGSFPITGNSMVGVNVTVGELDVATDGSLAAVKLGDKAAEISKFKITNNNVEDATVTSIALKKDSSSTANDSVIENAKLYMDGNVVATSAGISGKYLVFNFTTPVTILKNTVKRFTVNADVVDGAGKTLLLILDSTSDVNSKGSVYNYGMKIKSSSTMLTNTNSVTINAGAVTIEKVNAPLDKIKKDQTNVEFGTFKVTVNSGKTIELSKLKLTIAATNETTSSAAFTYVENLEIFNKTNNTTYDLSYLSGSATKIYQNTNMGLILQSGVTNELVVRADVKSTATNQDYTVSIASAITGGSAADVTMKETGNDTVITDITPNSVSLKKVTVETASVLFSTNALASVTSVVGTNDIKMIDFNIKAGQTSDVRVTTLKFKEYTASTTDSSVVSEYKLYKSDGTLIKSVSGSMVSSEEITFSGLNIAVPANQTVSYYMTVSLVKDSNNATKTIRFWLSGYSAEETTKGQAIYDTTNDDSTANDGIIGSGDTGYANLRSGKTISLVSTGYLTVAVDNTSMYNSYVVGGTTSGDLAKFKMKATNEDISVTKIKVTTSASLVGNVTRLALYNDAGTEVAYTTNITASPVELNSVSASSPLVIGQMEKTYTLRATYALIGQGQTGANDVDTTFKLSGIEANGYSSGDSLAAGNGNSTVASGEIAYEADANSGVTNASVSAQLVGSKVSAISLETSAGGQSLATKLANGVANNVAIIKVTLPASSNTLIASGNELKTALNEVKVSVGKSSTVTNYTATIERIGGTQSAVAATSATTSAGAYFNTSGNTDFTTLQSGQTYYFLVKLTPNYTATIAGDTSITVGLDAINVAASPSTSNVSSSYGNFEWVSGEATALNALRIAGVNSITGTTISN